MPPDPLPLWPWSATVVVRARSGETTTEVVGDTPTDVLVAIAASLGVGLQVHPSGTAVLTAAPLTEVPASYVEEHAAKAPGRAVDANVTPIGSRHPETAQRAAQRAFPRSGTIRRRIFDYIAARPAFGATDDQLEVALVLRHQTASAARRSLVVDGWLEPMTVEVDGPYPVTRETVTRTTRSGADALVWTVTPAGRAAYNAEQARA